MITTLLRPNIQQLSPYSSARSEFEGTASIFLDANENPFKKPGDINRYPDPLQKELKKIISIQYQVREEEIFLGSGSDEAIDLLIRCFIEPKKDYSVICPPTYGMYKVQTEIQDGVILEVPLNENFDLDLELLKNSININTKLLFLCSPNNPTGNALSKSNIESALKIFPGIVVVDEAYAEFGKDISVISLLSRYNRLCVLRTFSKALGLAGIRLGMLFGNPELIAALNSVKYPYNINALTAANALEALSNMDRVQSEITTICEEREELISSLKKCRIVEKVFHSDANFILVRVSNVSKVMNTLKEQGIIIRNREREPRCEQCVRITVGTPEENQKLIFAMEKL